MWPRVERSGTVEGEIRDMRFAPKVRRRIYPEASSKTALIAHSPGALTFIGNHKPTSTRVGFILILRQTDAGTVGYSFTV